VLSSQATKLAEQPAQPSPPSSSDTKTGDMGRLPSIAQRFVPYYCECLLENSSPNRLHTNQLRLAYTSLVQFTIATSQSNEKLSLYVLYQLKALITNLDPSSERRHALVLTFISCLGVLPLRMLPSALKDVEEMILMAPVRWQPTQSKDESTTEALVSAESQGTQPNREQLVRELFDVLFDQVGYVEKEYVKEWWYEHRDGLLGAQNTASIGEASTEAKSVGARM
jgi:hypothetical protein